MPEFAQPLWLLALLALPLPVVLALRSRVLAERRKRVVASVLRALALGSLAVALAGPLDKSYSRHADLVFALDVSSSIDRETAAAALEFVNRALAEKDPAARMGLVVFGAEAAVELLLRQAAEPVREIASVVGRDGTDIGRALEVAVSAFPTGGHRRVVLLSDGRENLGAARSAAAMARAIGVEVVAVPLEGRSHGQEVYVERLSAPSWVRVHEPFEVHMTLQSNQHLRTHLVVMRNGALVHDEDLDLEPGVNVFSVVEQVAGAGLYEYEVVVNSDQDGVIENNRYQTFVEVRGAPKVLHVVGEPGLEPHVSAALRAQGLTVDEVPGDALPGTMHRLVDYDLVILNNVSGFDVSLAKMSLLEEYVRDAGGGLVMLGGDRSYSAGGYHGTPVERLLPVDMDVRSEMKIPSLAVVILIDKSGSMSSGRQGEDKISIAKSAALSAIEVLNPLDRVGVLAFDTDSEWTVPPTEVGDRRPIVEKLHALRAGGGTELFQALEEAHRVMREQPAKVKHLIVLSDGLADTGVSFEGLTGRIAADGITVSTVAFGEDADRALMAAIARWGSGRFYHTEDARNVPRIFTSETMVVARDLLVERETLPAIRYPGEMLEGFAADAFPPLGGYLRTFAKPAAQVLLGAADEDPLLVSWRYGLGKSVAFTSNLSGRWGRRWVDWPDFGRFVAQMARWTMRRAGTETMMPTFSWRGRRGEMLVDVLDRDERFVNGLELQAVVSDPERGTTRLTLEQIAPGRYRGEFDVPGAGRYYVNLAGTAGDLQVGPKTFGLAVGYSSEYVGAGVDREHLDDLATMTGGRVLPLDNASIPALAAVAPDAIDHRWRVWWPLLLAALVCLVLEVAVRKVALPRWWRRRWQSLRGRAEPTEPEPLYDALVASITEHRERHLEALRESGYHLPDSLDSPVARARLYVAGQQRRGP